MQRTVLSRFWVLIVAAVGLAVVVRVRLGSPNAAENAAKSVYSFGFNALAVAQLPSRNLALAKKFSWPAVDTFRNTYSEHHLAQPIPVVTGHLIVIGGSGLTARFGSGATWEDVMQILPQARAEKNKYELAIDAALKESNRSTQLADIPYADVSDCPRSVFAFFPTKAGWRAHGLTDSECRADILLPKVPRHSDGPVIVSNSDHAIAFKPDPLVTSTALHPDLWESWAYSTTLMKLDRALYKDVDNDPWKRIESEDIRLKFEASSKRWRDALEKPDDLVVAAIRRELAQEPLPHSEILSEAAKRAEQVGDLKLAIEVRSYYQPMGMCSMDTRPQEAAREYADLCFKAGDLACYLNLQVKIMGDNFERVAYSSYGEASHDTEAERLRDIGIDVPRFLRGLIVAYAVQGSERDDLGPWRLARSIVEAGESKNLRAFLRSTATNADIDPYNRLRTTQVWAYVEFKNQLGSEDSIESRRNSARQVSEMLGRESLHPVARDWIKNHFVH